MLSDSDKDYVTKYEVMIETPPIVDQDASVFLVRHGFSEFNYKHLILKKDGGKEGQPFQDLKAHPELVDAQLSGIGVHQALVNASHLQPLNITRVMVSPMRRALQTAIHMFKNHPNLSKMTFLVVPQCHEIMHTSNDIPMDCYKLMQQFAPG